MRKKHRYTLLFIFILLFNSLVVQAAEEKEMAWQDELIYSITVDRFNNGNPSNDQTSDRENLNMYQGGDLRGVIDKLDYVQDMGFTAILLSPIVKSQRYEGDVVEDYFRLDEHYGTTADLKQLVEEVHKRDMKILLSFVAANENDQLIEAAKWWSEKFNIDGYKINELEKRPDSFWKDFVQQVKELNPQLHLIGEVLNRSEKEELVYRELGFDMIVSRSFLEQASRIFSQINTSQKPLYSQWEQLENQGEKRILIGTVIDNENTVRFTRRALEHRQHPGTKTKLAVVYLFSSPGVPIVYYGTEIALDGGEKPDNHRLMNFRVDKELIDYVTKVSAVRNQLPSLRRGTFELLYEKEGMIVYKRHYEGETAVVAINNTSKTQVVDVPASQLGENHELRGLLEEDNIPLGNEGYRIALERETANIYVLGNKTGVNKSFVSALIAVYTVFILFLYFAWKRGRKKKQQEK